VKVKKADASALRGDFQTPPALAKRVAALLLRQQADGRGVFRSVLEPTCGTGTLLLAALEALPGAVRGRGLEISAEHLEVASARCWPVPVDLLQGDVFASDFVRLTADLPGPVLVLGNPPWVTSSAIGLWQGGDREEAGPGPLWGGDAPGAVPDSFRPRRENTAALSGVSARTGGGNFDVSEAVTLKVLRRLSASGHGAALLLKRSVAVRTLAHAERERLAVRDFAWYEVDVRREMGVSVAAGLLCFRGCRPGERSYDLTVYPDLEAVTGVVSRLHGGHLVEHADLFASTQRYARTTPGATGWRSGLKHDVAPVLELHLAGGRVTTPAGEVLDLEPDRLYPLLKSTDLAAGRVTPRRMTLVTQSAPGEQTDWMRLALPRTWAYLTRHEAAFAARKSAVYRGQPRFALFGVGPYAFLPYKVAVSGLHKRLRFTLISPVDGRAVMVDDTCAALGFQERVPAVICWAALHLPAAHAFFAARTDWRQKRPVTIELLERFSLPAFVGFHLTEVQANAQAAGVSATEFARWWAEVSAPPRQPPLWEH